MQQSKLAKPDNKIARVFQKFIPFCRADATLHCKYAQVVR